jgi:hypothetical protein
MDIQTLNEKLRLEILVNTADYPQERIVRSVLSQLRKEGILFIPSDQGKGIYIRIDHANRCEIESYAKAQARHFKTQYFNTMLPMKRYVEDLKLLRMLGRLEGILDEES